MTLFHASRSTLVPAQRLKFTQGVHASAAQLRGIQWVNDRIDRGSGNRGMSRSAAVFAFDDVERCRSYALAEERDAEWRYYEVQSEGAAVSAPFVLSNHVLRLGQESKHLDAIVREYWDTKREWHVMEHLLAAAIVVGEVPLVLDPLELGRAATIHLLAEDQTQARRLWPLGD